jgi:hypothetical protein
MKNFLTSGTYFSTLFFFEENLKKINLIGESQRHLIASVMARIL